MIERAAGLFVLLLVAAPSQAQATGPDPDALAGMQAEVREDWVRAVEAFRRSGNEKPTARQRARLRYAKKRGAAHWSRLLAGLIKAKRYEELPGAVALARLISPRDTMVSRAARIARGKGLEIPIAPPEDQDRVKEFPYRSPGGRMRCWTPEFRQAEAVIDKALDWLVRHQSPTGEWNARSLGADSGNYDAGVTGLALLALVSRGPAGLAGARGKAAHSAAAYLVKAQTRSGSFNDISSHAIYITALATEALAEYAVIARKRKELAPTLERARDHLLDQQAPGLGWRYERAEVPNDTAVTGRVICALERLRRAGIPVPDEAFGGALAWTDSVTDPEFGQIGYNLKGGSPARPERLQDRFPPEHSQSMTAAGCLIKLYGGRNPRLLEKSLWLMWEVKPRADLPDMYYWGLGARAWQAARGYVPRKWYAALLQSVTSCVGADGGLRAKGPWSEGGRVYATSICVMALAAPYREPVAARASGFLETGKQEVTVRSVAPAGIYLDAGVSLKVTARDGVVAWRGGPELGPEGTKTPPKGLKPLVRKGNFGCLLARIGPEGKPFRIKNEVLRAPVPGQLYLLVNDLHPQDNDKGWTVSLELVAKR